MGERIAGHIRTVSYRRLVSFGNYENEEIGATAEVLAGMEPHEALVDLKAWVEREVAARIAGESLASKNRELEGERRMLEENVEQARRRWEKAKAFLERHGLSAGGFDPDEIPF